MEKMGEGVVGLEDGVLGMVVEALDWRSWK